MKRIIPALAAVLTSSAPAFAHLNPAEHGSLAAGLITSRGRRDFQPAGCLASLLGAMALIFIPTRSLATWVLPLTVAVALLAFVLVALVISLLVSRADIVGLAPLLVIVMNAMMTLPFVYQTLAPALTQQAEAHDRLCASLGISGWNRFRHIDLPALKRPIGLALVMAFILSLGDLTAISLFGTQDLVTLPALIYRQMGSYRFNDAIGTALMLAALVLALTTLAERWSRKAS